MILKIAQRVGEVYSGPGKYFFYFIQLPWKSQHRVTVFFFLKYHHIHI